MDHAIDDGSLLVSAFIDYVAAFDHFLDEAMSVAGGSDKCRMVFRAIYGKAAAVVRVQTSGGEEACSSVFPIMRGVLQGDVLSPLCFVLALQRVMQLHDTPTGVTLGSWLVTALEYADDQALLETDVWRLSQRTSSLQARALASADMTVSVPKTEVLLFEKHPDEVLHSPSRIEKLLEAGGQCFRCSHRCGAFFDTDIGREIHESSCWAATRGIYEHEYEPEEVVDVRGQPGNRFYQVVWKGWPRSVPENVTWEPARHLVEHTELLESFWSSPRAMCDREIGTREVAGEHRCQWCCKFCRNDRAKKLHEGVCSEKPKVWKVRKRAAQTAVRVKRAQEQAGKDQVQMGRDRLKNVFNFVYLGHCFQADGDSQQAAEVRMAKAKARFKELHAVWRSEVLSQKVKLMLYTHAVISILAHGHEAWDLNPKLQVRLNGWNSRCVAIITGRDIRQEAGRAGQTFDLVSHLRVRRLKWVGHVLRMDDPRYPKQALRAAWERRSGAKSREGSVLMDVPECVSFAELEALAGAHQDHAEWSQVVRALREKVSRQ